MEEVVGPIGNIGVTDICTREVALAVLLEAVVVGREVVNAGAVLDLETAMLAIADFDVEREVEDDGTDCRVVIVEDCRVVIVEDFRVVIVEDCRVVRLEVFRVVVADDCRIVVADDCRIVTVVDCRIVTVVDCRIVTVEVRTEVLGVVFTVAAVVLVLVRVELAATNAISRRCIRSW